jgi:gamma-glutamyltranspeptidase/glutathione hydrolase
LAADRCLLVHAARPPALRAYDGRETAPAAATPERFLDASGAPRAFRDVVATGPAVGVPGTLRALELAHAKHGKLAWAALFAPAIALADAGFAVSPRLAGAIAADPFLARDPRAAAYFFDAGGKPLAAGAILRNPAYAATLRTIARDGADAFYRGPIAEDVVATVAANASRPGDLTLADLAGYRAIEREPLCGWYRRYRVCGFPPPSSGATTVLAILGMLEPYDIAAMGAGSFWSAHFLSEAGRLAYADRNRYVGDPAFVDVPDGLTDPAYLRERSRMIRTTGSLGRASAGDPPRRAAARKVAERASDAVEPPSTSHLSIVDADGNAVSMTTTIEDGFGTRMLAAGGFLLNNQLTTSRSRRSPTVRRWRTASRRASGRARRCRRRSSTTRRAACTSSSARPAARRSSTTSRRRSSRCSTGSSTPRRRSRCPTSAAATGPPSSSRAPPARRSRRALGALGHDVAVVAQTSGTQAIVRTPAGWVGGADPRREGTVRGE